MPEEKIIIREEKTEVPDMIVNNQTIQHFRKIFVPNPNYAEELIEEIKNG